MLGAMKKVLAVLVVAACGSKATPPEPLSSRAPVTLAPPAPRIVASLTRARDAMCACRDSNCARTAQLKLRAWSIEYLAGDAPETEQSNGTELRTLLSSYQACLATAHQQVSEGSTHPLACDVYEFWTIYCATCFEQPREARTAMMELLPEFVATYEGALDDLAKFCVAGLNRMRRLSATCGKDT